MNFNEIKHSVYFTNSSAGFLGAVTVSMKRRHHWLLFLGVYGATEWLKLGVIESCLLREK